MAIPKAALLEALKAHLTPERLERIESVAQQRTRKITLILEDLRDRKSVV